MLQLEFFFIKLETSMLWDMEHLPSLHNFLLSVLLQQLIKFCTIDAVLRNFSSFSKLSVGMQVSGLTRHWQTSSRILVPFVSFGLKIFKIRFRFCASLSQPPLRLLWSRETSKSGWFSATAKTSHSTCSLLIKKSQKHRTPLRCLKYCIYICTSQVSKLLTSLNL